MRMMLLLSLLLLSVVMSHEPKKNKLKCNIPPNERQDCGFVGLDQKKCEEKGCCFLKNNHGSPWCFNGTKVEEDDSEDHQFPPKRDDEDEEWDRHHPEREDEEEDDVRPKQEMRLMIIFQDILKKKKKKKKMMRQLVSIQKEETRLMTINQDLQKEEIMKLLMSIIEEEEIMKHQLITQKLRKLAHILEQENLKQHLMMNK